MFVDNSFSVFINKLRVKVLTKDKVDEEILENKKDNANYNDRENEWLQEYELIYRSYALER